MKMVKKCVIMLGNYEIKIRTRKTDKYCPMCGKKKIIQLEFSNYDLMKSDGMEIYFCLNCDNILKFG